MKFRKAVCLICAALLLLCAAACDASETETPTTEAETKIETEGTVTSDTEGSTASENTEAQDTTSGTSTESESPSEAMTDAVTETDSETVTEAPECTHSELEWSITKLASCTETGSRDAICLACGEKVKTETTPVIAHTEEIIEGTAASCTSTGLTAGKKCSVCNEIITAQEEIPMLSHTEEIITGTAPTCTEDGQTDSKICSVCKTVLVASETLAALNHSESDWMIDTLPTTETEGTKHTECTRCGEVMNTATIPTISVDHTHEGVEWLTTLPATCTTEGRRDLVCECGEVLESEVVECIPHTEQTLMGIAATCTSAGLTEGKQCSVCKTVTVVQTPTAKAPHTEQVVTGRAASCTEGGITDGVICSVCSITITAQLPLTPLGHNFENEICTGCGKAEPYGIWIVDGLGNPVSDIIIKIFKDGNMVKMYPYKGEYLSLDIDRGNYTIELDLSQLKESYTYDESLLVLTPDKKNTTIRLFKPVGEIESLYVSYPLDKDYDAHPVVEGSYKIKLTPNDYTFLIFKPKKSAIYTLLYECDTTLSIGYHGGSFFVQGTDLSDSTNSITRYENGLALNVYSSEIGGEWVFSIYSNGATSCILNIKNAGDPGTRLDEEPWTPYLEDEATVNKQLSASKDGTYTAIDITDLTVSAVFNEADGYYHLGSRDGAIIYIDLTSDSQFIKSIQTICANQRMGTYIYDDSGKVAEKRSYNELFIQYGMPTDTTPVDEPIRIPLTKKLAEAVQSFGDKNGWWGEDPDLNIFASAFLGAPYNQEYAWLLYCGIYQ